MTKFSDLQFQPFYHICVKSQGHTKCQFQIIELEPRTPIKIIGFSGEILIKLRL